MKKMKLVSFWLAVFSLSVYGWSLAGVLPDTGQTKCYDASKQIACPQPGEDFYGQDAQYAGEPQSYTLLQGGIMVQDNVTGLIWESKTDDGSVHDKDNGYTWYDSNRETNGGEAGKPGNGTDTEDFINTLNSANFGGFSDWRLPTIKELSSILDRDATSEPGINTYFFPHAIRGYYCTSETYVRDSNLIWTIVISMWGAGQDVEPKSSEFLVRAVRGEAYFANNFVDNGNGTVTDVSAGLTWHQEINVEKITWKDALSYCENLTIAGYDDWRMPNVNELQSIVDYTKANPVDGLLPVMAGANWSSTSVDGAYARSVGLDSGGIGQNMKAQNFAAFVRCVRDDKSLPSTPIKGDFNGDKKLNLGDIIGILKVLAGGSK
jgi:hypothetical protein